jgi:predicted RND superfamily exporter protein
MRRIYRHPWTAVGVVALITAFFALQLQRSEFDNDMYRFIPEDDPARVTAEYMSDNFGSSDFVLVGLENADKSVFEPEFLRRVKKFVDRVEQISVVDEVSSIVSADYITAEGDSIIVEELVGESFNGTAEEIARLKGRLASWDLYGNALVSDDFSATQVLATLKLSSESARKSEEIRQYMEIRSIAHEMFDDMANVYVTGLPVITATMTEYMKKDLVLLVPIVIAVVVAVLFLFFRRTTAVLITFLTVLVATIWTMGALPLLGMKLTIISSVLPVVLIAVGSAYGILVMTFYISEMRNKVALSREAHTELVVALVSRVWKSVFLAALTTFAGFVSFCFTNVIPIREWGVFASFGVVVSFVIALTLMPAVLIIRGPKPMRELGRGKEGDATGINDAARNAFSGILLSVSRKRRFVMGAAIIAAALSVVSITKLIVDNVFIEYFNANTEIARSDEFIRRKFGGSKVVNLVVQADSAEILLHPDSLLAMDELGFFLKTHSRETGKALAFTDLVKRVNQVFNANEDPSGLPPSPENDSANSGAVAGDDDFGFGFADDVASTSQSSAASPLPVEANKVLDESYSVGQFLALLDNATRSGNAAIVSAGDLVRALKRVTNYDGAAYYEIPSIPERYGKRTPEELQRIVANYLALISGSIGPYANDPLEPTAIKMAIQLRTLGAEDTRVAIDAIHQYTKEHFPKNVTTLIGGPAMVEESLTNLVVSSQMISLCVSLLIVFLIIAISNHSLVAGLIGLAPLIISILINFAVMSFLGIKLNIGTSLVAGLAVGIGIDYTIHFMETYKEEYRKLNGQGNYLHNTFSTVGLAIVINAVSVGLGFAVLMLSEFVILRDLGFLIAQTMGISALVALTVIPVLMESIRPKFIR